MEFLFIYLVIAGISIAASVIALAIFAIEGDYREARLAARAAVALLVWPIALTYLIYYYGWVKKP